MEMVLDFMAFIAKAGEYILFFISFLILYLCIRSIVKDEY